MQSQISGKSQSRLYRMCATSMLVALSVVSVLLLRWVPIHSAPFLEYDFADVFILIGAFFFGPLHGFIALLIASAIQALTVSTSSQLYGFIMHIVASGALLLVSSLCYKYFGKGLTGLIIGLLGGTFAMTLVMIPMNLIVTPYFMHVSVSTIRAMLWSAFIPFNLLKAGLNSVFSAVLFLPLKPILQKLRLL